MIVSRVAVSISLVVLLTLTTPWARLLAALRALFVPKIFILIIGMAYRYLFLLLNSVTDMYTARKARAIGNRMADVQRGPAVRVRHGGSVVRQGPRPREEVHMAMVSRGYSGDAVTLTRFRVASAWTGRSSRSRSWRRSCAGR